MKEDLLKNLSMAIADGETDDGLRLVKEALDAGIPPLEILNEGAAKGMDIVNERYNEGEAFLPELMVSGDAMTDVIKVIFDAIKKEGGSVTKKGTIVIGQAKGDVHDIGKNIVSALLSVNGFEVHNIGVDAPVKKFIETAKEVNADIIAMSTLLTTSLPYMKDVVQYIEDSNQKDKYYFIIGGGPVTPDFAKNIKADGWARTGFDAVDLCKKLMERDKKDPRETVIFDSEVK